MQTFSNFTGFALSLTITILTETYKGKVGANISWGLLIAMAFMAFVASLFIKEDLRLAKVNKKDDKEPKTEVTL
jgi:hypothetical protein